MTELSPKFGNTEHAIANETLFHLTEAFYSRTDKRGIIKAGNSVFHRVSGFDWDELIGAPHKVVRHPDMPKGVFHLFWQQLQAGKPVGAYIKNRSKSGRYYWLFALVSQVGGDYISIRIKPSSEIFSAVQSIYKDLKQREQDEGFTPEQSAEAFRDALRGMGYSSYAAFQSTAVAVEIQSRAEKLGRSMTPLQQRFLKMSLAINQVQNETTELTEAFKQIRTVPMNMRIIASRLGSAGGPISAISVNYSQMLEDMSTWVTTFVDGDNCVFSRIRNAILNSQFLGFESGVAQELVEQLQTMEYAYPDGFDQMAEADLIESHRQDYISQTSAALLEVEQEAKRFGRSVLDMKRYVTGLSSTRMMCKIESASLSESGAALAGVVDQLDAGQNEIEERLSRVVELNSVIQSSTAMLRSLL